MPLPRSKVTSQGQISIPAEVRKKLGVGPGSVLEWEERGDQMIIRRSGKFSSQDIHLALFGHKPPWPRTLGELKEGIQRHIRDRNAPD